jgi:aspartate racemase
MKEKTIGILGGMGPEATLDFFGKIIQNTPATSDQEHLRVIIDNNPKIPDRTEAILGKGESPVPVMVQGGLSLAKAGADFIVIPCISAHFFLDELRCNLSLPIISAFAKQ